MIEPELVDVGGSTLFVQRRGTGDPVLLINGIGANHAMWESLDSRLDSFSTIAYDSPGVGRSPRARFPLSMARLGKLAATLVEVLELDRVDVIGYSFGGAVAQELARQAPDRVRRVVLVATGCGWGGVPGRAESMAVLMTPLRYHSPVFDRLTTRALAGNELERDPRFVQRVSRLKQLHPPTWSGYAAQLAALTGWSSLPWLDEITHPTLVVHGDQDPLVPLANGAILASRMPDARLLTQRGEGHFLMLDPESSSLTAVTGFLEAADHRTSAAWKEARVVDGAEASALIRATRGTAQPLGLFNALARAAFTNGANGSNRTEAAR